MYLNHVELIGFTGSDAETKTTPNGKAVTTSSIATKTSYIKDGARSVQLKLPLVQFCTPVPRNAFRDWFTCISDFGSGGTARADIQIRA